jgi:hypothetical protein
VSGRARGLAACGLVLGFSLAGAAELRRVEAVGAVPAVKGTPARQPREEALARALAEAVRSVALEELGALGGGAAADPELLARVDAALGGRPRDYANRYRVIEDRGERAALFSQDPAVEREYVVVVEVYVDGQKVRSRLVDRGLLVATPSGEPQTRRVTLIVEELRSYRDFEALRALLLGGVGARSAVAREFEPGRAVLAVESGRGPAELLQALLAKAPPELQIESRGVGEDTLEIRLSRVPAPAPPEAGPAPGTRGD